jgi:hypothetical protein
MQLDFAPDCLLGETVPIAPNRTSEILAFMRTPENRIALARRPSPRRKGRKILGEVRPLVNRKELEKFGT